MRPLRDAPEKFLRTSTQSPRSRSGYRCRFRLNLADRQAVDLRCPFRSKVAERRGADQQSCLFRSDLAAGLAAELGCPFRSNMADGRTADLRCPFRSNLAVSMRVVALVTSWSCVNPGLDFYEVILSPFNVDQEVR
jgi:hypothetical protein